MDERQQFLRSIEADPEDDTPRLVFADWFEEHGDEDRARFIRLQCEYHRRYGEDWLPGSSAHRRKMEREIEAILKRHREEWSRGLPAWAREKEFKRGFLHVHSMTGKQFLDSAAAIRAVAPLATLFLRLLKGWEKAVLSSEHLGGVGRLRIDGAQVTDAGIAALAADPHLRRLRQLDARRDPHVGDVKNANKLTDRAILADDRPWTEVGLDETQVSEAQMKKIEARIRKDARSK